MENRLGPGTAAAALIVAGVVGCSGGFAAVGTRTAQVAINGNDAGRYAVTCHQLQRLWTIESLDEAPSLTAVVDAGDPATAKSVQLHDVGGFTGSFWEGTTGDAEATVERGTFRIAGSAEGSYADNPDDTVSATFTITTDC